MPVEGEYEPSPQKWVRDQVAEYEASGGARANTLMDRGIPVVIVTTKGAKTGKVRKLGLMRVEHAGEYALVASMGGAPQNPVWYHNLKAHPSITVEVGTETFPVEATEVLGSERQEIWAAAVAVNPGFGEYQRKTTRTIPVVLLTRA